MHSLLYSRTSSFDATPLLGRIGRGFVAIVRIVRDWNDRRVTRSALMRLTDRELNDIGLTRQGIEKAL